MKITILALHLGYGGIEKFISNIANMFEKENQVEIISIYKLYDKPAFYINPNVKIKYLLENLKPNREEFYKSIKSLNIIEIIKQSYIAIKILYLKKYKMKQAIKKLKSDVVISTIAPHNKLLSKYGKKEWITIATEHNYKGTDKKYVDKVINSCKNLNYLVIASKQLTHIYTSNMKNAKCKLVNIPLCLDNVPQKVSNLKSKEITYIGRLSEEKGVIDLIEVFKKVHEKDSSIILNIVGEGTKKDDMLAKAKEYDLENNIIFHGFKQRNQIEEIMLNTSIGINTSYTESFGLAVLETFSFGIPCVAFSSAEGLREIIDNNKNGYLIENRNFEEMSQKIIELTVDEETRNKMGYNAREKSLVYTEERIKEKWYKLLK